MILCIDFGLKNIGIAVAQGPLAEPYMNLRVNPQTIKKIVRKIEELKVDKVVIGISEGKIGEATKNFARQLQRSINVPIVFQDETLTTKQAVENLREIGSWKKKRTPEHTYAAALILQDYLDENSSS